MFLPSWAIACLAVAVGLWYWFNRISVETLKLGAGMELRYKDGLTDILCDEALAKEPRKSTCSGPTSRRKPSSRSARTSWTRRSFRRDFR